MNVSNIIGRLTKDPEILTSKSGIKYTRFIVEVKRTSTKKTENAQTSDFINCIAWRKTAETLYSYFFKGSLLGINGRLGSTEINKDGETYYRNELIVNEIFSLEKRTPSEKIAEPALAPTPLEAAAVDNAVFTPEELPFEIE